MYNLLNVKLSKHISRNYTLKCIFSFYEEYKGGREENPQSVNWNCSVPGAGIFLLPTFDFGRNL